MVWKSEHNGGRPRGFRGHGRTLPDVIGPTCRSCWSVCLSVCHINTKHDDDDDADQAYDVDVDDDYNEDDDHDKNDDTDYDNDKILR